MRIFPFSLILPLLLVLHVPSSLADGRSPNEKDRAITSCSELAKNEGRSWSMWASSQGITKSELIQVVNSMCLSGISAAEDADRASDLDEWQIAMFNRVSSLGLGPLNVTAVQKSTLIAKKYYASFKNK